MKPPRVVMTAALGVALVLGAVPGGAQDAAKQSVIDDIRDALWTLPYYGVFDFLAFSYEKGTVTLQGYSYWMTLKDDAEHAAKHVAGVDAVDNRIEELPVSQFDDVLRWRLFYAIYSDPFLSRYAPGGGVIWRRWRPFPSDRLQMFGDYGIHIIVRNGRVTLMGDVDSEGDKTLAGFRAREVPGSFSVENELTTGDPSARHS